MENTENKQPEKKYDPLNGDHSAKSWFKIMWGNSYIQLVILAIAFIVAILVMRYDFNSGWELALALSIPTLAIVAIVCLGFIKFWNELKGKK